MGDQPTDREVLEARGLETGHIAGRPFFRGIVGPYRRMIVGRSFEELRDVVESWETRLG